MKNNLKKFLKAHGFSLIIILMFSIALKISVNFLIILSFPVLVVLYLVLGVLVEYIQEKIRGGVQDKTPAKKADSVQAVRSETRQKPAAAEQHVVREMNDRTRIENHGRLEHQEQIVREEKTEKVRNSFADFTNDAPDENTVVRHHVPALPNDADFADFSVKKDKYPQNSAEAFMAPIKPIRKTVPEECPEVVECAADTDDVRKSAEPAANEVITEETESETAEEAIPEDSEYKLSSDFLSITNTIFNKNKERNSNREAAEESGKESETVSRLFYARNSESDKTAEEIIELKEDIDRLIVDDAADDTANDTANDSVVPEIIDLAYITEPVTEPEPAAQPEPEPVAEPEPIAEPEPAIITKLVVEPAPAASVKPVEKAPVPAAESNDKVRADQSKIAALFSQEPRQPKSSGLFRKKEQQEEPEKPEKKVQKYTKPSLDILRSSPSNSSNDSEVNPDDDPRAQKLMETLSSFGVGAKVTGVTRGPAVTRYEVQPNPGVKVSRIVSLSDDISLNLAATGVRIEAPIPGKEAVGIEVPNKDTEMVFLRDVLESKEFSDASSKLTFAIGKDIAGNNIVWDIAKMPHLLIAGATGSGKSVCINTIIASVLYKASPDEVKMIMVDPKIVELGIYNGIPHLLVPVVNNPKKAAAALAWAVNEMEYRYTVFSQYNVRDMKSYNAICQTRKDVKAMPHILIIIDELADLMMVAAKEIEDSIIRLAQKARAAGLHIVIATQRPSVDVITGLIKANIPSRIAFAVSSQIDSRTILDGAGAEKLLGRGDMLFHPVGISKALRVQGAFVSDGEIEMLVDTIKNSYGDVEYSKEIQETMEAKVRDQSVQAGSIGSSDSEENDDGDADMIESAAELALEYKQLSTSFLQRKLKLGYSRASRIIDTLEEQGLISPADGSKPRQLMMTREEWEARNS